MFTGLIEEVGTVVQARRTDDALHCTIEANAVMDDLKVDDSVAVNGVCLTVTSRTATTFDVTAVAETLSKTTTKLLQQGSRVNLERAVRLQDRLGGHLVQGHVDATGAVDDIVVNDAGWEVWFAYPRKYRKWLIPVGSITVNGVSLTVADLDDARLKVALIPHTLQRTTLGDLRRDDDVNLEFDLIAKYVESINAHP